MSLILKTNLYASFSKGNVNIMNFELFTFLSHAVTRIKHVDSFFALPLVNWYFASEENKDYIAFVLDIRCLQMWVGLRARIRRSFAVKKRGQVKIKHNPAMVHVITGLEAQRLLEAVKNKNRTDFNSSLYGAVDPLFNTYGKWFKIEHLKDVKT